MKMLPIFKKIWLSALRSSTYSQARSQLGYVDPINPTTSKTYHCCLGVLACELDRLNLMPDGFKYLTLPDGAVGIRNTTIYPLEPDEDNIGQTERSTIPFEMCELVGLDHTFDTGDSVISKLIRMNDGADFVPRKTFAEIADWIEENL